MRDRVRTMVIDFRSDACSLPTAEMRRAMARAEVGNDDFSEDPTINLLEEEVAELLGKPAALFVQSGTMANLAALLAQVNPGDAVLVGPHFHIYDHEGEAVRRIVRSCFSCIPDSVNGFLTYLLTDLLPHPEPNCGAATSAPRLLVLENSVNRLGGTLISQRHLANLAEWSHEQAIPVHLDGARLFNAAAALGVTPAALCEKADTVMVVFTKALAAPAGAALAGEKEIIERARNYRYMLGGNWKQGGVLAAACLVALRTMLERIPDDHMTARRLAEGLHSIPGIRVELQRVVTNIVQMHLEDPELDPQAIESALWEAGVRIGRFKNAMSRLVTYKDIGVDQIDFALERIRESVKAGYSARR
jgi:threonine aldolase